MSDKQADDSNESDPLLTWLGQLGLERYAPTFYAQGVDLRSLPMLSEADLVSLGVLLGHRKLLLSAARGLDGGTRLETSADVTVSAQPMPAQAERRQITVMFCDLMGSTAMANRLDPETLRELMHEYQQVCGAIVERYAGHVAQYLGDGLMAYFGWPRAHEDDAERAVHAACEIVIAVKRIAGPEQLAVRVGIATGPVVVGDTGSGDASVPKAAVGPTPNLAARLQALAGTDQIIVAPSTRRLLGSVFRFEDLGERSLKGIDGPVTVSRIIGLGSPEGRFEASRGPGGGALTPFVGREGEVEKLLTLWECARSGKGQVVLLSGEAGIGKSRITDVLRERLGGSSHARLRYQCSPYHGGTAFHPIISQLERSASFAAEDSSDTRLDKLESALILTAERKPTVAPLFAALLSLPIDRYPKQVLSSQRQRELTIEALGDQALALSTRQPLLMLVEDVHWVDPSTLETLGALIGRISGAAILMVITHRPEFVSPWSGVDHLTSVSLSRLSPAESTAIVARVTSGKPLPESVLAQIVAKTDGVPLFVEELTKTVLEGGLLRDAGDRWVLDGPVLAMAIPSTLQDSLMARLDRLSPIKEVAQVGACIGREFSYELLAAVSTLPDVQLRDALAQLEDSELIFGRGQPPQATYTFKHALVQDAAYESLLKSRRLLVHRQIAEALESRFPQVAATQPQLLALHLTKAGMVNEALPRWLGAAQVAMIASRNLEAVSHVNAGLDIVDQAAAGLRENLKVALLTTGGACHFALAGYASTAAAEIFGRVEGLLPGVTNTDVMLGALVGISTCAWTEANFSKALAVSERLGSVAEQAGDLDKLVLGRYFLGLVLHNAGQFVRARGLLELAIDQYQFERHFVFVYQIGSDIKGAACAWISMCDLWLGYPETAHRRARAGIAHARGIAHPFSFSIASSMAMMSFVETGEFDEAFQIADQCVKLCDEQSLPFWKGWALVYSGVGLVRQENWANGLARLDEAKAFLRSTGGKNTEGYIDAWRAIAMAYLGNFADARTEADAGRVESLRSQELAWLPHATFARAVADLLDPSAADGSAEHWLRSAIDECRSQGNRWIELRAATALARLWQGQNKATEARNLLEPIYDWFTEGLNTSELKDARLLLDELKVGGAA